MKESDLYLLLEAYLKRQGYRVQGEVCGCDLVALKDEELLVVELKTGFTVKLLYQAVRRLAITPLTYAAVPRPSGKQKASYWQMLKSLSRRLGIGLFLVDAKGVKVLAEPGPFQQRSSSAKRSAVLKEFHGRRASTNIGGVTRQKINTAYLESAVHVSVLLHLFKNGSAPELRERGAGEKTYTILYNNHYGWFEKTDKGRYKLKPGQAARIRKDHPEIWDYYLQEARARNKPGTASKKSAKSAGQKTAKRPAQKRARAKTKAGRAKKSAASRKPGPSRK